ncbi:S-DNA-T family DNA segregation ATPase FtsK/SpoIIIE [Bosea sp. BE125]|uniref:DNA translocase FtsK n=1 Tax=Bosea sp. BE125 TaxID=2817909 RepID=UPI002858B866|nr:DNA translocase FtsK [Bosea sp. BE125]MDR6872002.1 S-DNA-T family DNA segregation ATPase FtsK/SpoIIIE [Bosea sp. BE125]
MPGPAIAAPVGGDNPAGISRSQPSQSKRSEVRYWRTPDRLLKQPAEPEMLPSVAPEADYAPGEAFYDGEAEAAAVLARDDAAPVDDNAASTPFALISDHAFWELLPESRPRDVEAEWHADENEPADTTEPAIAGMTPFALAEAEPIAHRKGVAIPVALPAADPAGRWTSASQAYTVSLKLSPRSWSDAGQGRAPATTSPVTSLAVPLASDVSSAADAIPATGRGIVVTRKTRETGAAQAAKPSRISPSRLEPSRVEPPRTAPTRSVPTRLVAQTLSQAVQPAAFELPPITILAEPPRTFEATVPTEILQQNAGFLEGVLEDFNVRGEIVQACPGPVVTLYELEPAPGTKSSRVISLADDIARSMSAIAARVAVIPGKNAIGIELPNAKRETVFLRELLASQDFESSKHKLALGLGKTIGGEPVIVDLARMPHLLVAGTTGSGKSVAINTMILSLLYRLKPEECRLIMVDPKMLELSVYDGIPHLLTPVVTDPKKAVVALKWAVREMEERYKKMSKLSVRNIDGFNARVGEAKAAGEVITRTVQTGFDKHSGEAIYEEEVMDLEPLPYIVVIVDEMADLMMVAGKEIEGTIQRLAQMARAAGIHVVLATQRPSVDVITGTIKANFPTRISFQVTSKIDSRTILGEQGAEQLLGQGDMLYMAGGGRITRVHGPFVSDAEVEKVVAHLKTQGRPQYLEAVTSEEEEGASEGEDGAVFDKSAIAQAESDDPYDQAVAVVLRDKKASTSYIQRRLQIGYNRAASIMERMENEGIVGPANHAGKREILVETGRAREDED